MLTKVLVISGLAAASVVLVNAGLAVDSAIGGPSTEDSRWFWRPPLIFSEINHFIYARLNILNKHINAAIPLEVLLKLSRANVLSPARSLKPGALTARAKQRLVRAGTQPISLMGN